MKESKNLFRNVAVSHQELGWPSYGSGGKAIWKHPEFFEDPMIAIRTLSRNRLVDTFRCDAVLGPYFLRCLHCFSILNRCYVHSSLQKLEEQTCLIDVKNTFPRESIQFLSFLLNSTEYRNSIPNPCFPRKRNRPTAKSFCGVLHPPLRYRKHVVFFVDFRFKKLFVDK